MRRAAAIAFAFTSILLCVAPAVAGKRVALVIGNDRYQNLAADQQLQRAVNDARAVGEALGRIGFTVLRGENLNRQALVDKFDDMARQLGPGDTAFFFFAGHGVTIGGGNYILPTDVPNAAPGQETRLVLAALGENDIVTSLKGRGVRVAVVVLDACRNNPFRRPGTRAVGGERGLARSEPVRGVFMLYSAGIGQTALDRLGDRDTSRNSVFTRALVPALAKPGLDLSALAEEVREDVARMAGTIGHEQHPSYYNEIVGGRVYLAGLPQPAAPAIGSAGAASTEAAQAWAAVKDTTNIPLLEEFAGRYADSFFAALARARMAELKQQTQVVAVPQNAIAQGPAKVVTPTGLQITDVTVGTGAMPRPGQTCIMHFTLWLSENGVKTTKIDSSLDRGVPMEFPIGQKLVIAGWEEGVATMRVGGKRMLVIPPALAYGEEGRPGAIPPNATLVFDVELLGVKG
jgi:FKBP-type peptidyl-prolyl cis-trans isomerase